MRFALLQLELLRATIKHSRTKEDSDYVPDASDNEHADYEQEDIIGATREKGLG